MRERSVKEREELRRRLIHSEWQDLGCLICPILFTRFPDEQTYINILTLEGWPPNDIEEIMSKVWPVALMAHARNGSVPPELLLFSEQERMVV